MVVLPTTLEQNKDICVCGWLGGLQQARDLDVYRRLQTEKST